MVKPLFQIGWARRGRTGRVSPAGIAGAMVLAATLTLNGCLAGAGGGGGDGAKVEGGGGTAAVGGGESANAGVKSTNTGANASNAGGNSADAGGSTSNAGGNARTVGGAAAGVSGGGPTSGNQVPVDASPAGNAKATSPAGGQRAQRDTPVRLDVGSPSNTALLVGVDLLGLGAVPINGPVVLQSAKNEWTSFVLQIGQIPPGGRLTLGGMTTLGGQSLAAGDLRAYQVLPVPVDSNRAGFVRHTGQLAQSDSFPRALLPLKVDGETVDLSLTRDPRRPFDPASRAAGTGQAVLVWVEFRPPAATPPGRYDGTITLASQRGAVGTIGWSLAVDDFVLPDERHLLMVGSLDWDALKRVYPDRFDMLRPTDLRRDDPNVAGAVRTLDQLVALAQEHRACLVVPHLQPVVKWPAGQPPVVDWKSFDSMITPWLNGAGFSDKIPLGYWPMPAAAFLENYPVDSRLQYYAAAASHFDQQDWIDRTPVVLAKRTPGLANLSERLSLSAEAQRILDSHSRVRVQLPLEPDQLVIDRDNAHPGTIDPSRTKRINAAAAGVISDSPLQNWPAELERPQRWLRTDVPGLIGYVGAGGNEGDVRLWAWLAFLRDARMVQWGDCLPSNAKATTPADPNAVTWFYPGEWFGLDTPLPSVGLKWLRRAEQDYEYIDLAIARERRNLLTILPMARVVTKPVEIQPAQSPDATYGLLTGTADPQAWRQLQGLLARVILVRKPGDPVNPAAVSALNVETLHFMEPLERPTLLPRYAAWTVGRPDPNTPGPWVDLRLGIDIYNASDTTPDQNQLAYAAPAPGWVVEPAPVSIPKLRMYQVGTYNMTARVNPSAVDSAPHRPVEVRYSSGFTGQATPLDFVLPVSAVPRRVNPLGIDGDLSDWTTDDAIQLGPMVKMLNRPEIQRHELEYAGTPTEAYAGWSDESLYVAFNLQGVGESPLRAMKNFVNYQFRRAWGEDVCQILVQPMYADGSTGPLLHVALKPSGQWVERRLDLRAAVNIINPWVPLNAGVRYAATFTGGVWRGELAIPWRAINSAALQRAADDKGQPLVPTMLKFNLVQHKNETGESASWAGPIDFGRDDDFMGVLVLKERDDPGMKNRAAERSPEEK